jgi:hypothetical protein
MLILQILAAVGVFLVGCVFLQLNQISGSITTVQHQLEYLGAPLEVGSRVAKRRTRTRWVVTSTTYGDGRVEYYIAPDEGRSYEPPE